MNYPEKYLSDEAVAEFDRIVDEYERPLRRRKVLRWTAGIAAAAAVATLVLLVRPDSGREIPLSPVEIAEGINQLMNLKPEEITSITAVPQGSRAILTARLKDGSECSYIMTIEKGSGTMSLVASNNKK